MKKEELKKLKQNQVIMQLDLADPLGGSYCAFRVEGVDTKNELVTGNFIRPMENDLHILDANLFLTLKVLSEEGIKFTDYPVNSKSKKPKNLKPVKFEEYLFGDASLV